MHKTLASRLSARFMFDGSQLFQYIQRKGEIQRSLLEDLVLHDQILIPTPDFLTADGLALIIGEKAVIDLLEQDRLKFIRTRSSLCYVRGSEKAGSLAVFSDPEKKKAIDSEIDESASAGLDIIDHLLKDRKKLESLLTQKTIDIPSSDILEAVRDDAMIDFRNSSTWSSHFEHVDQNMFLLPGIPKMGVRVIGMNSEPLEDPINTLLSLVLYNSDLHLGKKFNCTSISPSFPVGDVLRLKSLRKNDSKEALWNLFEMNSVPDFCSVDLSDYEHFNSLHRATVSKNAQTFREWFHSQKSWEEDEIIREYISVLNDVPWTERLPTKALRFLVTTGLGLVPGLEPGIGLAASALEAFGFDKVFSKASPKFFINDLRQLDKTKGLQKIDTRGLGFGKARL